MSLERPFELLIEGCQKTSLARSGGVTGKKEIIGSEFQEKFADANMTYRSHATYETHMSHTDSERQRTLVRNKCRQFRSSLRSKFNGSLLGFFFRVGDRHHDAHHCAVRTTSAHAVDHGVDLAPVLAGERT